MGKTGRAVKVTEAVYQALLKLRGPPHKETTMSEVIEDLLDFVACPTPGCRGNLQHTEDGGIACDTCDFEEGPEDEEEDEDEEETE